MIRVILPTGLTINYTDASHTQPVMMNGTCATGIFNGDTKLAEIIGPCVCDEGAGSIVGNFKSLFIDVPPKKKRA